LSATTIVVVADYATPDEQAPTGTIIFDLTGTLSDVADGESIAPRQVMADLDANGRLAQPIVANTSPGLVPTSYYWISERIVGAPELAYSARVPAAPAGSRTVTDAQATVGLPLLTSTAAAFGSGDVGAYVNCPAFPIPTQIVAVTDASHAVLSTSADESGILLTALIGASIDLAALRP
jgi:hypothetical protein